MYRFGRILVLVAVGMAVVLGAGIPAPAAMGQAAASQDPTGVAPDAGLDLDGLKRATVLLTDDPSDPRAAGHGSGSIISDDGLILTNAHVAADEAPGQGRLYGEIIRPDDTPHADFKYVYTIDADEPAEPAYRARVVAADGYLDLAVLRIFATADGTRVDPSDLDLVPVPLADSGSARIGDAIRVLGFPGVNDSFRISVTPGVIENIGDDKLVGLGAWLNTDATFSGGNSGGLAADAAGRLLGIPTLTGVRDIDAIRRSMRPVDLAKPLIAAAEGGQDYDQFQYVVPVTGNEQAEPVGWGEYDASDCDSTVESFPSGTRGIAAMIRFTGMPPGAHVMVILKHDSDDPNVIGIQAFDWQLQDGACFPVPLSEPDFDALPDGSYRALVLIGPNYEHGLLGMGGGVVGEAPIEQSPDPVASGPVIDQAAVDELQGRLSAAVVANCVAGAPYAAAFASVTCDPADGPTVRTLFFDGFSSEDAMVAQFDQLAAAQDLEPCRADADDVASYRHITGSSDRSRYFCYQNEELHGLTWIEPAPGLVIGTAVGDSPTELHEWWQEQPAVGIGHDESVLALGLSGAWVHVKSCERASDLSTGTTVSQITCKPTKRRGIEPADLWIYQYQDQDEMDAVWQDLAVDGKGNCAKGRRGTQDWDFDDGTKGGQFACARLAASDGGQIPWFLWNEHANAAIGWLDFTRTRKGDLAALHKWWLGIPALALDR